jgi:hypothetical protein
VSDQTQHGDISVQGLTLEKLARRVARPEWYYGGTKSSAFAIDWQNGYKQNFILGANALAITLQNPEHGAEYFLALTQDGTGSRTLPTFPTNWDWGTDGAPTLTTTAGKRDVIHVVYDKTADQYHVLAVKKGYASTPGFQQAAGWLEVTSAQVATTQIAVSGLGFTPKLILFFWNGRSNSSNAAGRTSPRLGFGAASGTAQRRCMGTYRVDTGDDDQQITRDDACVVEIDGSAVTGLLDLNSFDADGFTMIVDDQFANTHRVFWLAIGGSAVTAKVGTFNITTGTGNLATTDPGFQPTAVILAGMAVSSINTFDSAFAQHDFGFATSSSQRHTVSGAGHSLGDQAKAYSYTGEMFGNVRWDGANVIVQGRADLVSMDATGFTINRLESFGTLFANTIYVAIKGCKAQVTSFMTTTDTGTDITVSGLAVAPQALVVLSHGRATSTQDAPDNDDLVSLGIVSKAPSGVLTQLAMAAAVKNGAGYEAGSGIRYDAPYLHLDNASAVAGVGAVTSLTNDGFVFRMSDGDPSAARVGVLALGPS